MTETRAGRGSSTPGSRSSRRSSSDSSGGLTGALNRYFEHESVALLVGFEALSFVVALVVWLAAPGEH
jgi:hypothetical protein